VTAPTITPATPELLAFAAAIRPDVPTADLQAVIVDAETRGWTWTQVAGITLRTLLVGEDLRDLRNALRHSPHIRRAARDGPVRPSRGP
jgi:hypothetical protein